MLRQGWAIVYFQVRTLTFRDQHHHGEGEERDDNADVQESPERGASRGGHCAGWRGLETCEAELGAIGELSRPRGSHGSSKARVCYVLAL